MVRAYRLLVERGEPGEVYNVCSGRDVAVQELADRLVAHGRPTARARARSRRCMRPVDIPVLRGDPSRLQAATGWAARRSPSSRRSPTCSTTCGPASRSDDATPMEAP